MDVVSSDDISRAASIAVNEVLSVQKGERVLIVTNPSKDVLSIGTSVYDACQKVGAQTVLIVQQTKGQLDTASPEVLSALRTDPDVVVSISEEKLGKDPNCMKDPINIDGRTYDHYFNYLLGEKKARSFWSPSVTIDMFERTVPLDYSGLRDDCRRVKELLDKGRSVRITAPSGTDIEIGIEGRKARADDGSFSVKGSGGNLPAGETFISPQLRTSKGRIAFDGSIASDSGIIIIESPILCEVAEGHVVSVKGGREAELLEETLERARARTGAMADEGKLPRSEMGHYLENITNLGELGIGLNRMARIVGNMLEDEKVYGTCHIAIGGNYDNDARALIHLDGLIRSPTIIVRVDGLDEVLMRDGELSI
ncbi:MAG: aminopeptidase [Candidatus Thermoplasmatota archaeon]|jgi:leucyl aminopeptidase (aminopeptidase T)|nr:aminopeptidase [Candidatus Thermoplasmatota archaeon]